MGLILSSIDFIKVLVVYGKGRYFVQSLIVLSEKKYIFFSIDKIDEDEKKPRLNEGDKKMKQSHLGFALVFVFV